MTHGERAKKWRTETMNMTQTELGKALGYDGRQTVVRMECGKRNDGTPYTDEDYSLYKNACAGLHFQRGKRKFNW